jgi:8-oxo-dGTP pyrophosphatase MutT (NUDIX family)
MRYQRVAGRIDFFDDPAAPKANSVVPSANVIVVNDSGDILMIRRADNDNWALPGGAMDLGESLPAAAVRETVEETGVQVEITGLVAIYTDPATSSSTRATAKYAKSSRSCSSPIHRRLRPAAWRTPPGGRAHRGRTAQPSRSHQRVGRGLPQAGRWPGDRLSCPQRK